MKNKKITFTAIHKAELVEAELRCIEATEVLIEMEYTVVSGGTERVDYSPPGSSVHEDSPGKSTGVGCHALLQGIFSTQ